ncbi:YicC family protein [Rubripirellula amarantea]|uniref:YicC family protein n=1 Tax=Rubripirellula amarantea TaxID=2527999 RepID=A0A5C5WSY4_9BACT|nr:YicC/YloC family endoribonuclease [Rubripirellula amarantea]MDA8743035.1 YicC family protein [Rubripirellula amarantea]TWT53618.1 Conserved hypothetical protein CHP00255 [Rubripirellula amarantea]
MTTISSSLSDPLTENEGVRSMTGQGHASVQGDYGVIRVEVRTVNNRGLKCVLRTSDALSSLESRVDALVRSLIHRGSISVAISWRKPAGQNVPAIDTEVLAAYASKLNEVRLSVGDGNAVNIDLASLMQLPGVIISARDERRDDVQLWEPVEEAIRLAFENLNEMRQTEGANMAQTLHVDAAQIAERLEQIRVLAPRAVENYSSRLEAKIQRVLSERDIESQPIDILREVQIYADRADISEEITRLGSHLRLFADVLSGEATEGTNREPTGRKLDFIIQEMFRETNTIGSKAADAEVSSHVVEIKCAIERMRELVQNLE